MPYLTKDPYATYQGAQMAGLVQAFYDFLIDEAHGENSPDELRTNSEELDLVKQMKTPYYTWIDVGRLKTRLEAFADLFLELQKIRTGVKTQP